MISNHHLSHVIDKGTGSCRLAHLDEISLRVNASCCSLVFSVFRLYIKSLGDKAVYSVEESIKMRSSLVDVLRTIRSPSELRCGTCRVPQDDGHSRLEARTNGLSVSGL